MQPIDNRMLLVNVSHSRGEEICPRVRSGLISDELQYYFRIYFISMTLSAISFCGICSNTINIIVFLKQGINDCVSLSLFALTLSDFGIVLCSMIFGLCFGANIIDSNLTFDPNGFQVIVRWPRSMFFMISMTLTAFVSVERCLCVVWPFRFKDAFTFRRTLLVVVGIFLFYSISYSPIYATYGMAWKFLPGTNTSRITVWLSDNRMDIEACCTVFNQISLLTACQIVIFTTTLVMVSGLKFSAQFRQRGLAVAMTAGDREKVAEVAKKPGSSSRSKEARVIKIVTASSDRQTDRTMYSQLAS